MHLNKRFFEGLRLSYQPHAAREICYSKEKPPIVYNLLNSKQNHSFVLTQKERYDAFMPKKPRLYSRIGYLLERGVLFRTKARQKSTVSENRLPKAAEELRR